MQPYPPLTVVDLGDVTVIQLVHDLRNQVTIMRGCAENLAILVPKGLAATEIAELQASALRASLLVREIVLGARPQALGRRPVDLNHFIESSMRTLLQIVGDTINIRLRLHFRPVMVMADTTELERILVNLALNARDAMADDGVLTIETLLVHESSRTPSSSSRSGLYSRLMVIDTGCGMPPEVQARMFEPYYTTKPLGTGLGLATVAATVRQLQGELAVQSAPGRGTSIAVTFPPA
jgi:two-component system cell cycle sensor histidine kinase/response regulator CckA